jgi:hypothetical protein
MKKRSTKVADPAPGVLLTPQQLAVRLAVQTSWVREKTRERARQRDADPLPLIRLGKYVRFDWQAVQAWLKRQSEEREPMHRQGS